MSQKPSGKARVLLVEDSAKLRVRLAEVLSALGHEVVVASDRHEALARADLDDFDLIISDLTDAGSVAEAQRRRLFAGSSFPPPGTQKSEHVKAFKIGVNGIELRRETGALRAIIEQTLACETRFAGATESPDSVHEKIDFEVPSDLSLMTVVIDYLLSRVTKLGLIKPERSNLFVALDEAFVNAVKHGNKNDPTKLLRITAELSAREAIFNVQDEGAGFNVSEIPDPCDPANLFRTSGRGVMLMYNIMDKVEYNAQGNRVTMVKRSLETPLIESPPKRHKRRHGG